MRGTALLGLKRAVLLLLVLKILAAPISLKRPAHDHSTRTWWVVRVSWSADTARNPLHLMDAVQPQQMPYFLAFLLVPPTRARAFAEVLNLRLTTPVHPRSLESMRC